VNQMPLLPARTRPKVQRREEIMAKHEASRPPRNEKPPCRL
jgi:hypothetical protein